MRVNIGSIDEALMKNLHLFIPQIFCFDETLKTNLGLDYITYLEVGDGDFLKILSALIRYKNSGLRAMRVYFIDVDDLLLVNILLKLVEQKFSVYQDLFNDDKN